MFCDVIELLVKMVFEFVKDNFFKIILFYDFVCGLGGMFIEGCDYLFNMGVILNVIQMYGIEVNFEIYVICKSDFIIKGVDFEGMYCGNIIIENYFYNKQFGYMFINLFYGKLWKEDKKKIYYDKDLFDVCFNLKLINFIGEEEIVDFMLCISDG